MKLTTAIPAAAIGLAAWCTLAPPSDAQAVEPPALIQFEARVTDALGNPVNLTGTKVMFAIYDVPSGGVSLFDQTLAPDIVDGHLSALIGPEGIAAEEASFQSMLETNDALYLGIAIDPDPEMVPRFRLASAPWALRALSAGHADDVVGQVIHPDSIWINGSQVIDAAGNWIGSPTGLVGPAGPAGPPGPSGPVGPTGPTGPTGIALPFNGSIKQDFAPAFLVQNDGGTGTAASFFKTTTGSGAPTVFANNFGKGDALAASHSGINGSAAVFKRLFSSTSDDPVLRAEQNSISQWAGYFTGKVGISRSGYIDDQDDFAELSNIQIIPDAGDGWGAMLFQGPGLFGGVTPYVNVDANDGFGSRLELNGGIGLTMIRMRAVEASGKGGRIDLYNAANQLAIALSADETPGTGPELMLLRTDGTAAITLDANHSGSSRVITDVLEIKGGADLVEGFDTSGETCEPGTVVVIDPDNPGKLLASGSAYDARVAGVVSGAGDLKPGLCMGQQGVTAGETLVAMTGRVYALCSAENGAIRAGDRLTTSATRGHAMRATDREQSDGAVLGKAMSALDEGTGLVLVLVNLQ